MNKFLEGVEHFKQSTIRIQGSKVIYFDPFTVSGEPHDADIVFVTHTHGDHFNTQDIKKVMKPNAVLVIPADGVKPALDRGIAKVIEVCQNKDYVVEDIKFNTIPAYNVNKDFHKKESNWVGYIVNMNNASYYISGDTDVIPEMKDIKADVVFLPVGGTYTMTAKEAADAANIIKPFAAVPIHFGDVVGSLADAEQFIQLLNKNIVGRILKK